jgi:hypothetical protein
MNCMVIECEGRAVVLDCGVTFPSKEPGVDIIHPDFGYIETIRDRLDAVLITHAHEDHIGALPFLLPLIPGVPVYGPPYALRHIARRLEEHGQKADLRPTRAGQSFGVGPFEVEPLRVNHSIPDATGLISADPRRGGGAQRGLQDRARPGGQPGLRRRAPAPGGRRGRAAAAERLHQRGRGRPRRRGARGGQRARRDRAGCQAARLRGRLRQQRAPPERGHPGRQEAPPQDLPAGAQLGQPRRHLARAGLHSAGRRAVRLCRDGALGAAQRAGRGGHRHAGRGRRRAGPHRARATTGTSRSRRATRWC